MQVQQVLPKSNLISNFLFPLSTEYIYSCSYLSPHQCLRQRLVLRAVVIMGVVRAAGISSKCSSSPPALWTPANKSHKPRRHEKNPQEHPFITAELDYKHLGCNQSRCRQAHAHTFIHTPLALQLPGEQYTHWRKGPLSQLHFVRDGFCVSQCACEFVCVRAC